MGAFSENYANSLNSSLHKMQILYKTPDDIGTKPFIRWVGGKTWLIPRLKPFIPKSFNRYFEPFLGSGAVYFAVCNGHKAYLSDTNVELVNAFTQVRDNCGQVIRYLRDFQNSEDEYYRIRATEFRGQIKRAAQFIFLNRTCFNGVYRVNRDGRFNVPYGHNPKAPIYGPDHFMQVSTKLRNAEILARDFDLLRDVVVSGDFVFLDPPYTVAHGNNGFVEYNKKLFSWEDQERLALFVDFLNKQGVHYVLTNAAHDSIRKLYLNLGKLFELERHSTITSVVGKRSRTTEYLFTNYL